jgi:hypothetical protein
MKEGEKRGRGRPVGSGCKYDIEKLAEELNAFIDNESDPRLTKFCKPKDKPRVAYLYDLAREAKERGNSILSEAITRAKDCQEDYLLSPECEIHPKTVGARLATNHGICERQIVDANIKENLTIEIKLASEEK